MQSDKQFIRYVILQGFPESLVIKKRLEGEILVVMSSELVLEFLNPVAKDFFLLIDGKKTLRTIVEDLTRTYDADASTIESDVVELVRELQRKRILRINSEPNV